LGFGNEGVFVGIWEREYKNLANGWRRKPSQRLYILNLKSVFFNHSTSVMKWSMTTQEKVWKGWRKICNSTFRHVKA